MNVLILSCNTGEGHNTAAKAMREEILAQGHKAVLLDMMRLKSARTSRVVGDAYILTAKYTPKLFGAAYHLGDAISAPNRRSPVYYANSRLTKYLCAYLATHACDAIVTSHLYGAEVLTYMKRAGLLTLPTLAIATDYTCIPFWEETRCDGYVLGHEALIDEFVAKGIARQKLFALGIPVSAAYTVKTDRNTASRALGFDPALPLCLVMGGSMAFGKMLDFTRMLSAALPTAQIAVLCGSDTHLLSTLHAAFGDAGRIKAVGYTHDVPLYMDACDVIFTKPGGLTSTEALCKNVPIVHTVPIPGCESKNAAFFSARGLSLFAPLPEEQVALGRMLIENPDRRAALSAAQRAAAKPNAAKDAFALLRSFCSK